MENMERFAPLYAIAYAIMDSMENLRFDKKDYFYVFPLRYRNIRGSLREQEIACMHKKYIRCLVSGFMQAS